MKRAVMLAVISALGLQATDTFAQSAGATLEEIVVTAQRREENLQDVPISIIALTGAMLEETGIRDPRDLQTFVPGMQFQSGTAATTTIIFLRGVGIGDFNANTVGAVGVYADEVYLGANSGKLFNAFDGDGIEVLRGPQGTLYGRNTTGGAIKFSSVKPSDELSSNVSLLYGNYNDIRLEGGIGGPLVADKVKVRVSGLYETRDGTTKNRVTGDDVNDMDLWAARAIVDFTPTDSSLLRLIVHGGQNNGGARQFQHRGQGIDFSTPPNPNFDENGVPLDGMGYADTDHNVLAGDYNIQGKEDVDVFGASLLARLELDGVTLTSITAYEKVDRKTLEDTDASPNNVLTGVYEDKPRQWSEELRAQSNGSEPLTWIAGAFFFHDDLETNSSYDVLRDLRPFFVSPENPTGFSPENNIYFARYPYTQKTDSWALFGQADYRFSDKLTLTAGLRYTEDKIDLDYRSYFDESPYFTFTVLDVNESKSFSDLSGRLALSYKTSEHTMIYGSISTGYNSGGFAGFAAIDPVQLKPFDPEHLYAYEVGFKSEMMDNRVRLNASAFYYDYQDLQVFIYDLSTGVPLQSKLNAGSGSVYGMEAELTVKPTSQFDAFLGLSLLSSEYHDFTDGLGNDYSGNDLVNAPGTAITAGMTYTQPLGDSGALSALVYGSYQSQIYFTPANDKLYGQDSVTLLNARLTWTPASEAFEVALWGKNLTDEEWVNFIAPIVTMDQLNYSDPRTYGVEFRYHFN
jgi:iron complex outermembrane receptor protein